MLKPRIIQMGREIINSGLVAGTWGNISAWDEDRHGFWITPSGMDYLSLKEEDLVLMSLQGQVLEGFRKPSSESLLHRAVYQRRRDVKGVVHTHSIYATAHAVSGTIIPAIVEDLAQIVGGAVEVAPYALPGTEELAAGAVNSLGNKNAVLLANHGLVGVGRDLPEALKVCQITEKSAQVHIMSCVLSKPVVLTDHDVQVMRKGYLEHYGQR